MRRLVYMAALALVAMVVLAPGAIAQQMNGEHMMPNGQMMDDSQMIGANNNNIMASPSASASASTSASASPSASTSPTATATASAPRSHHHHGGGGNSTSAVVGGRLPSTGGVPLVSVGALALLLGSGLVAARLLRRST